jgi:hypothetical protein
MKKILILLITNFLFTNAWADMFCPNNFNSINIGDSLETVLAACGKPDNKTTTKAKPTQPQEWVYFIAASPGMPGTLRTTIAFDANGQVVNMSVNGAGVTQTQICGNQTIRFGDSQDTIQKACGKPEYVNQTSGSKDAKEIETTELQYNSTPPVTLTFKDGKLQERKENR